VNELSRADWLLLFVVFVFIASLLSLAYKAFVFRELEEEEDTRAGMPEMNREAASYRIDGKESHS
jgi:hypothetical protein